MVVGKVEHNNKSLKSWRKQKEIRPLFSLRIHWRFSTILKRRNKSVWSNVFSYIKVCIFWKFVQYTIHWDKTQMLKNKRYKKCTFLFWEVQLRTVLLLIGVSYMCWSTMFISLKVCGGFSIFHSPLFSLKFIFFFEKQHGLFYFKTS